MSALEGDYPIEWMNYYERLSRDSRRQPSAVEEVVSADEILKDERFSGKRPQWYFFCRQTAQTVQVCTYRDDDFGRDGGTNLVRRFERHGM